MDTIRSQRAREFRDLYLALSREEVSNEERAELLVTLKYAVSLHIFIPYNFRYYTIGSELMQEISKTIAFEYMNYIKY